MRARSVVLVALVAVTFGASASGAHAFSKAIWGPPYRNGVNQFPLYKRLGVKIIEADLDWADIAPKRPENPANLQSRAYLWPHAVRETINQAKRYHIHVLLQIIGAPPWSNGGHPWNWAPRPGAYAVFAAAAARRYPYVHLWMVWGEPNRKPNWEPETPVKPGARLDEAQKVAPHNYARMLNAAYGSLKAVSPRNLILGGSTYTTGDIDTQQWIKNLKLPDGKPPRMDIYAHNPFSWRPPSFSIGPSPDGEVQFADLPQLAGWIDRYLHRQLPIFLSEWTIPSQPDQEFDFYVDPNVAATWVSDALRLCRGWPRIYGLGWIHVYDDPPESYGGLLTAGGQPKPVFSAFANG